MKFYPDYPKKNSGWLKVASDDIAVAGPLSHSLSIALLNHKHLLLHSIKIIIYSFIRTCLKQFVVCVYYSNFTTKLIQVIYQNEGRWRKKCIGVCNLLHFIVLRNLLVILLLHCFIFVRILVKVYQKCLCFFKRVWILINKQ